MPITTSAKKALRASATKRTFNERRKTSIERITRDIRVLISEKKAKEASALVPKLYKAVDKAAKSNYIKKNTASRIKSRVAASISKASSVASSAK